MKYEKGGVVERGNRHHNTHGLGEGEANLVESGAEVRIQGERFAIALRALKGREANDFASPRGFATGLTDALAHFGADGVSEGFDPLIGKGCSLQKYGGALVGGSVAPEGSSGNSTLEGGLGVAGTCQDNLFEGITGVGGAHGVKDGVLVGSPRPTQQKSGCGHIASPPAE